MIEPNSFLIGAVVGEWLMVFGIVILYHIDNKLK